MYRKTLILVNSKVWKTLNPLRGQRGFQQCRAPTLIFYYHIKFKDTINIKKLMGISKYHKCPYLDLLFQKVVWLRSVLRTPTLLFSVLDWGKYFLLYVVFRPLWSTILSVHVFPWNQFLKLLLHFKHKKPISLMPVNSYGVFKTRVNKE